jgi:TolA-binding protein
VIARPTRTRAPWAAGRAARRRRTRPAVRALLHAMLAMARLAPATLVPVSLAPVALALALLAPIASAAGRAAQPAATASNLKEIGDAFESSRLLSGAPRERALADLEPGVQALLHRGVDADRLAVAFLAAAFAAERGDAAGAVADYRRAGDLAGRTALADDAEFGEAESLEQTGRDAEAARIWVRFDQRFPASPLLGEVRLRSAWNALRRGHADEARRSLVALAKSHPWMADDARVRLARATTAFVDGRTTEAVTALGPSPEGPAATWLAAQCALRAGSWLRAAALFQRCAERWPDGPLRDPALLAGAATFLDAGDYHSAAEAFGRVVARARDPKIQAEAELRGAGAVLLAGGTDSALVRFRDLAGSRVGTDVAARAQFLAGSCLEQQGQFAQAITAYNAVLTSYFRDAVAASAQYRVARCLDRLGRRGDATGAYQAVVSGYPLSPEAPAAGYLAGAALLKQGKPLAAAPYFQLVLDRYAARGDSSGRVVFASPAHQELTEAALCLLELSYHRAGDIGRLAGAPHVLLQRMPASRSPWRAWALLIDADAQAAMGRYAPARATLEALARDNAGQPVAAPALQLLAWTYAREGRDSLAIAVEEQVLAAGGSDGVVAGALLDIAHERFNQKRYADAAAAYDEFVRRFPDDRRRAFARYQSGVCALRLDRSGDAVDRFEAVARDTASGVTAERALARAGDVYFESRHYGDAERCYRDLLDRFPSSTAAAVASLRLGQCAYNAGRDTAALAAFAATMTNFAGTPAAREARRGTELSLYRLSQRGDGEAQLAALVEQFPGSGIAAGAQFQIGRRHYLRREWDQAAEAFRQVVSRFPSAEVADQAEFLAADCLTQAGHTDEALRAWERFLADFPSSPFAATAAFRQGLLQFANKDWAPAALAFTRALDDSAPREVRSASRYNLALCERLLGRPDDAAADLARYRAEFGADARAADVAFQEADMAEDAGHPDSAAAAFARVLDLRPRAALAAEAGYRLGRLREQRGAVTAAIGAYEQAAALGPRDAAYRLSALARLAALYEGRHQTTRALEAWRDIARNAKDRELVAAAEGRVSQLERRRQASE